MRLAEAIQLTEQEKLKLNWIIERHSSSDKLVERAKIILMASQGFSNIEIANHINITRQKVARWRQRFIEFGIEGLEKDATRPGRMPELDKELVQEIVQISKFSKPKEGEFWTQQSLANEVGVSASSISRIWKKFGIDPKNTSEKQSKIL